MKEILDRTLLKEEYKYILEGATLDREEGILKLDIRLNYIMNQAMVLELIDKTKATVPGVSRVEINFTYKNLVEDEKNIIESFIENIEMFCPDIFMANIIRTSKIAFDGENIVLLVAGEKVVEILNDKIATMMSMGIKGNFNIDKKFVFSHDIDGFQKALDIMNKEEKIVVPRKSLDIKPIRKENKEQKNPWKGKKKQPPREKGSDILLGKNISGEPMSMLDFSETSGECLLEGEIFAVTDKDIGNSKHIVTILFSDMSTSISGNFFIDDEAWQDLKDELVEGINVMAKGKAAFDTYANSAVLRIRDLVKKKKNKRVDTAPIKRVELHAHTKMSSLDGLSDIKEYVKQAKEWGHTAVALTDHGVVQAFPDAAKAAGKDIKIIYGLEGYLFNDDGLIDEDGNIDYKNKNRKTNHIIILAKNREGLKNLYKLVSLSHIDYFYRRPRIPKSILKDNLDGLVIGSACEAGELFQAVLNGASEKEIAEIQSLYDYFEIQPIINNQFLVDKGFVEDKKGLEELNRKIVELGEKYNKPVVATCDAHYINSHDATYRKVIMASQGYRDLGAGGLYFRTTDEMLEEFSYLGEEKAYEVVVENTNKISDMIEFLKPVPDGKFPPHIENADNILREQCYSKAKEIYGEPLPERIATRLADELTAIIDEGYAVMYVSAQMLVKKSMEDGYYVGSRGSVGSSFAATMAGITEVNPLPPHYICPSCKNLEWGDENLYDCGVDMPKRTCPVCGETYRQDGFTIPFETFLGIPGKIKEPDIDLNFAGEYQNRAHKYVDEIFGAENVFKAGTIGTVATKTAFGYVKKYSEERSIDINKYEIERLAKGCEGVKRTTGQHPGGIIILPKGHEIYEFSPVQRPANDMNSSFITTHFDYHAIDENLLKLDILGHDAPSIIRHLQDMTGIDPMEVPLNDEGVKKIFLGVESLNILDEDYPFVHGSYGIPEFGTQFVRGMLDDTLPQKFADLVRISGFSHGTAVWLGNARDYIKEGVATMQNAISTRDDIMNYLILKGVEPIPAFTIMEKVRKGKGVSDEEEKIMLDNGAPQWYVDSCRKIQYMFPRAHAVAYVMVAYRIAWFKVYQPSAFYAAYLTTKIDDFNWSVIKKGKGEIKVRMSELIAKGKNATTKEQNELLVLEVCYELLARGVEFKEPSFKESHPLKFNTIDEVNDSGFKKIIVPIKALNGVGENCANLVAQEYAKRPFLSVEEIQTRAKANKSAIETFRENGMLEGLAELDQVTFF